MATGGTVPLHRQRPTWLHPSGRVADTLLAVALVMLAVLPLATVRAADGLAIRPVPPEVDLPRFRPSPAPALRDLPALSDGGQAAQLVADRDGTVDANALRTTLGSQAALLLGPSRAARLLAVVGSFTTSVQYDQAPLIGAYPYHYRVLDGLLQRGQPTVLDAGQRAGANDLAGLLLLAAAQQPQLFPNAAPAAFALLDQARASGACLPQLNLAFLMATDTEANSANVTSELRRAADACPSDPTPLWLLGQYQLGELLPSEPVPPASAPMAAPAALAAAGPDPRSTFVTLERRFPGSPAGWSGEADAEVRVAYQEQASNPFRARDRFRRARALYRRAERLDGDRTLLVGEARAAAGLGLYREAADLQRRALTVDPHSLPLQARLIDYLEHAHAFVDAAAAGARFLAGPADFPNGQRLFPRHLFGIGFALPEGIDLRDVEGPLSLGVGRLQPVEFQVGPSGGKGGGASIEDFSFIPTFHDTPGVTGFDPWCPQWSYQRDSILAGDPARARVMPAGGFTGPQDVLGEVVQQPCGRQPFLGQRLLPAVAAWEAGDRDAAIAQVRADSAGLQDPGLRALTPVTVIEEARQNLWRFAGDLQRAEGVVREWRGLEPRSGLALDRAGEVAFLKGDVRGAATLFASAAAAGSTAPRDGARRLLVANRRLKEGAALKLAGDREGARRELLGAARLATTLTQGDYLGQVQGSSAYPIDLAAQTSTDSLHRHALQVAYNARAQAGDVELRAHNYPAAAAWYDAALALEPELGPLNPQVLLGYHPEVAESNLALTQIELGDARGGLESAQQVVRTDPANPIFLEHLGFAQQCMGRNEDAARSYAAAASKDPTLFPALNDLGVIRARQGRYREAVRSFRMAVGVNDRCALGWFNLGVALGRLGPSRLLAAQGALGHAVRLDPSLRSRKLEVVSDDEPYFTTLDLSRPLPPQWSFATSQRRGGFALATVVVLGLLLGGWFRSWQAYWRGTFEGAGATELAGKLRRRWRRLRHLPVLPPAHLPAWLALVATLLVFLGPAVAGHQLDSGSALVLGIGVATAIVLYVRVRTLSAERAAMRLRHFTWTPSLLVAAVFGSVGGAWAPLPASADRAAARRLHWVGPLALGLTALGFLLLARLTGTPVTRALGVSALTMMQTVLLPVRPYDGAYLSGAPRALLLGAWVWVMSVLVLVGVL
jgi:tetratricopeptide (TPR) repeat protein